MTVSGAPYSSLHSEEDTLKFRIMLADAQPLTSAGIRAVIAELPDMHLVAESKNQREFSEHLAHHRPSVVIVDYSLPDFITLDDLRSIRFVTPATKVLIISGDQDRKRILEVLQLDISGYLTKTCRLDEIGAALESIRRGEKYFAQKILALMLDQSAQPPARTSTLTERERQLLQLLAKGYSTQRAADEFHVSPHTIHSHRKKIIRKLGIQSPTQYVIHAIEMGLLIV